MAESDPTQAPTLSSIARVGLSNRGDIPFSDTIMNMQSTGFHTWGFIIYRCVSSDETSWDRYLVQMRNAVSDKLAERGQRELLEQYLTWTIIEDPVAESASAQAASSPTNAGRKKEYRQRFDQWCRGRSIERDGRGAEHPATGHLPRFNFCVLVDDTCLETFRKWEHWVEAGRQGQEPIVAMILLDANCDQYGNGRMNFPVVEGCTREYTGWMYADVRSIPGLYDKLHYGGLTDGPGDYARPPLVYPGHQHGARIS